MLHTCELVRARDDVRMHSVLYIELKGSENTKDSTDLEPASPL